MPHRSAYVCLSCRLSFKHSEYRTYQCPRCRRTLLLAGDSFEAPPRRDRDAWRVVSVLLHAGLDFRQRCCGCGPGYRPRTLREVREGLAYARRRGVPVARALATPSP
ncbi:deoxyxylulose-5-phosphate synthase [Streptomyces sp. NBC_01310]|uniref:deoxyxylulose-5-phosphate synthase n=1 Tax=Streptomyces sp. NBC_01310 TaxID=2903820 RepID=UPI0035B5D756|nr:deoxyxylulose-5-phosphate synthase [Streptomyces sp. NBC_01310]